MSEQIINKCDRLDLRCIRIPQQIHESIFPAFFPDPFKHSDITIVAAVRHGQVVQYAFETLGFNHDDIVMVIDSDIFLIKELNIRKFLEGYEICGFINPAHKGMQPNIIKCPCSELTIFNMPKLPRARSMNFNFGVIGNKYVVTFGFLQFYLYNHPEIKCKFINDIYDMKQAYNQTDDQLIKMGFSEEQINLIRNYLNLFEENQEYFKYFNLDTSGFIDKSFLNYRGASWKKFPIEFAEKKTALIKNFIEEIILNGD